MAEINLLPQKQQGFFSEERLLVFARAGAVMAIVIVFSLSILFFVLSRDSSIISVKNDQSRTLAQLNLLQNKTAKYLIVLDRVSRIKLLQKNRTNFDTAIQAFTQLVPSGAVITSFSLDKQTVSLSISASDLSLLGKTVDNFISLINSKKVLKDVTVDGLVSDEKAGKYVLTINGDLL